MRSVVLYLWLLIIVSVPGGLASAAPVAALPRCFPESGYCIRGPIQAFFETQGGVDVFGLPVSDQRIELLDGQPVTVQWFERARFEQRNGTVELGRVGVELLRSYGVDWWTLPQGQPAQGCVYFDLTRHTLCDAFLIVWQSFPNAMTIFGAPVSEPRWELHGGRNATVRMTQWFERARFEMDVNRVVFGSVGAELLARQPGIIVPDPGNDVPPPPRIIPTPTVVIGK